MITILICVILMIVACYALAVVICLPLLYFVRLHHFRFGLPPRELSTARPAPLADLELENVVTLEPGEWWIVDDLSA